MKNSNEHVHKYQLITLGGTRVVKKDGQKHIEKCSGYIVFKCMIPNCTHFISKDLVIGRKSICWKCNEPVVLNTENTRLKKPTHVECRKLREILL